MPKGTGIERIAEWCYDAVNKYLRETQGVRCNCIKVEVFEHQDNSAIYEQDQIVITNDLDTWSGAEVRPVSAAEQLIVEDKKPKEVVQSEPIVDNEPIIDDNPLYGKRQTNKWIDKDSKNVWGW